MTISVKILTQTIPQLFQLCDTIREAAAHAAQEPESAPAMRADIAAGIQAVEAAARQLPSDDHPASADLEKLAALAGAELTAFVNGWFAGTMGPYLVNQFQRILKNEYQFTQEDAQTIAHWILNHIPLQPAGKRDILLELGMRCTAWAPEFSWNLMSQVLDTIEIVRQKLNTRLKIFGILFTMYDARTNLSDQVIQSVRQSLKAPIFETVIPRNVRLAEAPSHGEPITVYDPSSRGAESYRLLASELLRER